MAATVSAWGKPGAWALDSEEHDAAELVRQEKEGENGSFIDSFDTPNPNHHSQPIQPVSDFPSLSVAVATKTKKKKPQVLSLSEFTTGKSVGQGAAKSTQIGQPKGLTHDELLVLPTGPRERSAEELERSSSRGFRSYGVGDGGRGMGSSSRGSDERRNGGFERRERESGPSRADENDDWGATKKSFSGSSGFDRRERGERESGPSRADEVDDWGAAKKSFAGSGSSGFERRERGVGFFDSQSRADESDSWVSKKSFVPSEPRRGGGFDRDRRGGYEGFQKEGTNGGGADSDTWGKKREEGSPNSDSWGKKREEGAAVNGRPKLVLQPRTVPVSTEEQRPGSGSGSRSKGTGSNPFGDARPREEVLKDKGQDWKKIDEQLESVKIKEKELGSAALSDVSSFGRKSFGSGNGRTSSPEDRTERSWKKVVMANVSNPSEDKAEQNGVENGVENSAAAEN